MQSKNLIKRVLKFFSGLLLILAILVAASLLFPRFMTGLFFSVNTAPIELTLSDSYPPRGTDEKTIAIVSAAETFLSSLDDDQKRAVMYAFTDNEQRSKWSNFPEGMIPRSGLKLGELSAQQQTNLDELLAEIMSKKGILNLEYQLAAERTFPTNHIFNKYGVEHFYVAFLGQPSATEPWMFQFGDHHLGINVTLYGADITFSPMLTGGQPLHIRYEGEDVFITQEETEAAQVFLDSLSDEQKLIAVRGDKPINLLLGPGEYGTVVAPEGIKGSDLTETQKQLLIELINTRLSFINENDYIATMATILAEIDDTYFGWWGPQGKLGFAYFRITGPSLVIEYSPQDDAGATITDHAHRMYRNPQNDYGAAWLSN